MASIASLPTTPIVPQMETTYTTSIIPRSPHVARRTGATLKDLYTAVYANRLITDTLTLDVCYGNDILSQCDNTSKVATLMTLPAELKLEIFDHLLRPGDVYVHWSARSANHDVRFTHLREEWDVDSKENNTLPSKHLSKHLQPLRSPARSQTQLFLVSKQIRQEAMHYYLAHNTFHLMGTDCQLPYPS